MRIVNTSLIRETVEKMVLNACSTIHPSLEKELDLAIEKESNENAKFALNMLKENITSSKELNIPPCQDTGMAVFIFEIGQDVFFEGNYLIDEINKGVENAYKQGCFRMSVLDPITRINTKTNTPAVIHTEIVKGDKIKIYFMPKGFGSENMSKLYMLTPAQGMEKAKEVIIEAVKLAGSNPCPPIIVGVGLGGTMEKACYMAKKALFNDIDKPNPDKTLNALEKELLEKINQLNIGAQGFHGNTTAFKVNILKTETHISALPVAINIQCHALRKEIVTI